jgi:protein tyrosine phosphatase (PTP) superfamily phosphohydrolase (DUF442 family)
MMSAGLPNEDHFNTLKTIGVTRVIDLLPGDRSAQRQMMKRLGLDYTNIGVDWQNPSLDDFHDYVTAMQQTTDDSGITLTHCRLNWRGAVFTYLYRITQLNESEKTARKDLLAIWRPNATWQDFIDLVIAHY